MFSSYTSHLSRSLVAADPELASASAPKDAPFDSQAMTKLNQNLIKYELNFGKHLKILLDALNYFAATETVVLLSLCARLQMAQNGNENQLGDSAR